MGRGDKRPESPESGTNPADDDNRGPAGPLDGSVTGTIGGGGPETGGPARRPPAPEFPPAKPENAASGRLAPDPIDAGVERERVQPVPTPEDREPPPRD